MISEVEQVFQKNLRELWEDYEPRKEQIKMAKAIEKALASSENLIVEAGTGVGKSLSYLIPAALLALKHNSLVVVSTETKSLQEQIAKKDIDIVQKALGSSIRVEVALGANNYLCKRKFSKVLDKGEFGPDIASSLDQILDWEKKTQSGIRSDYPGTLSNSFWNSVSRDPENCLAKNCPNFAVSYYFLEKEKWKNANILIVNHSLLSAHLAGDLRILPPFKHLIIDEAHSLADSMGKAFGFEATYEGISTVLNYLYLSDKKSGLVAKLQDKDTEKKISKLVMDSQTKMQVFFQKTISEIPIQMQFAQRHTKPLRLDDGEFEDSLLDICVELQSLLENYKKDSDDSEEKEIAIGIENSISKLKAYASFFEGFRLKKDSNLVHWIEPAGQNQKDRFYRFYHQPKNVDKILEEKCYPEFDSVIFTSATITTNNQDFSFFKKEIGLQDVSNLSIPSPFPFSKNCLLFVPKNIADPVSQAERNRVDLSFYIEKLIRLTHGRTFVLFTSNKALQECFADLSSRLEYPMFSQVELGPIQAKKEFFATKNSVLFGVSSFWQGIDVKGEQLSQVIIAKLPFQVPTEPILQAKMEDMEKEGKNPFWEMQIPKTCLTLKQGFGRLIRSAEDTGIVSILDPRIHTKTYGKNIIKSLPEGIPFVTDFEDLKTKYGNLPKY